MKNLQSYDGGETIITRFGKTEVFDWSKFNRSVPKRRVMYAPRAFTSGTGNLLRIK